MDIVSTAKTYESVTVKIEFKTPVSDLGILNILTLMVEDYPHIKSIQRL